MSLPPARISLVTLGVADLAASVRFYAGLGFVRKVRASGDAVAFFEAGGVVLALWWRDRLAADAQLPPAPLPPFRGLALAWNCASPQEVDAVLAAAGAAGGRILKPGHATEWGGYSGYFADPDGHAWEVAHNPGFPFAPDGRLLLPD